MYRVLCIVYRALYCACCRLVAVFVAVYCMLVVVFVTPGCTLVVALVTADCMLLRYLLQRFSRGRPHVRCGICYNRLLHVLMKLLRKYVDGEFSTANILFHNRFTKASISKIWVKCETIDRLCEMNISQIPKIQP